MNLKTLSPHHKPQLLLKYLNGMCVLNEIRQSSCNVGALWVGVAMWLATPWTTVMAGSCTNLNVMRNKLLQ